MRVIQLKFLKTNFKYRYLLILIAVCLGCVSARADSSEWLEKRYKWAKGAIDNSKGWLVAEQIFGMLDEQGGDQFAQKFIVEFPVARTYLYQDMELRIAGIADPVEAKKVTKSIGRLKRANCLSDAEISVLLTRVDQRLAPLAASGTLALDQLTDGLRQMLTPAEIESIFRASLGHLEKPADPRQNDIVIALIATLKEQSQDSPLFILVNEKLPFLYLTEDNLLRFTDLYPEIVALKRKGGLIGIPQHVWDELDSEQQRIVSSRFVISPLPGDNYGIVINVQVLNESTTGSTAGSQLGAAYGSAAYVDSAFSGSPRNWNYSATNQITARVIGGLVGSLLDTKPEARFHARYTIRSGHGAVGYVDNYSSNSLTHPVGMCVYINPLQPTTNDVCTLTKEKFLKKYVPELIAPAEVYCKFATVPVPVKLPQSVCVASGGAVLR
jgi:hypothetical protein